jgi:outer membrane protein OmpA-like peptidoglycan-associated protein
LNAAPRRPLAISNLLEKLNMNRTLIASAVLSSLLLGACATTSAPPQTLVDARTTIRNAELDPGVLTHAPVELKKATASLERANRLQEKGEALAEINSAAYIANQQGKTAMAIAAAKANDAAIAGAELDRERARADSRNADALRAQAQAGVARDQASVAQAQASNAQAQASAARAQTANAEQRASGAEAQAAVATATAMDAQQQNAQLQRLLADLQAKQTERGMLVTLGDVLFESGRAEVKPGAQASLRKLADFLQQYPSRSILIEGHTDSVGSAASNAALSQRRADAVDAALVAMGLAGQRTTTVGYGEDYPVADNGSDTNRALNRRVEVYIADNDQAVKQRR